MIATEDMIRLLIAVIAVIVLGMFIRRGYRRGVMKELRSLAGVAVAVICIILILIIRRAAAEHTFSTVIVVAGALVILSMGWRFLRMILDLLSGITELPIVGFADKLLGAVMGAAECAGVIWIAFKIYGILSL